MIGQWLSEPVSGLDALLMFAGYGLGNVVYVVLRAKRGKR